MSEWNKQTYINRKAERLYKVKKLQYSLFICLFVTFAIASPIMVIVDDWRINKSFDSLDKSIDRLYSKYDVPELALVMITEIKTSIDELGLEPTDNSAYFGNSSTRDVQHFLDFLTELERDYYKIIKMREDTFTRFNLTEYDNYKSRLDNVYNKIIEFSTPSAMDSFNFIAYGAYLNKTLGPINLFNFRFFSLNVLLLVIALCIVLKIKDRLDYLPERCVAIVHSRYNISD